MCVLYNTNHNNKKKRRSVASKFHSSRKGGGGIRTHGALARTTVFKTAPINRSGTPPCRFINFIILYKFFYAIFF